MSKRRTKGDGGLYQRHDHATCPPLINGVRASHTCKGRWVATIELDGRRKTIYGRTQRETKLKLNDALRQKQDGTLVVRTMTTGAWLDHWAAEILDVRPQTRIGYLSKIRLYLKPHLGKTRLTDLEPDHIRRMLRAMEDAGLSEATRRQAFVILRRALTVAVRERKIGSNPCDRMDAPSTETEDRTQLTPAQAATVLAAAKDDARWWLALFYGLRQGEVLGLRWCDVDFERHEMRIEQSLQIAEDGTPFLGPPKSRSSKRPLPLVGAMEARMKLKWENAGRPSHRSEALIWGDLNYRGQRRADWQAWRDLLDNATQPPLAPIPVIALHAARNSAASLLEAAGVPDRLAAQILGHANVKTTHGYQAADMERMRQALEAAGNLLELE